MTPDMSALAAALLSPGPHPELPAEHQIFAPFIGSWDLLVTWYGGDGRTIRQENGEWHFAWVLEGRAVQDVWIVPPRANRVGRNDLYEYGTSLRVFDPALGAWRSTWFGPGQQAFHRFVARRMGDDVVLETEPDQQPQMRWAFSDITPDGFVWRNYSETEQGTVLVQSFLARRRSKVPAK
jgi:hypothetical protein